MSLLNIIIGVHYLTKEQQRIYKGYYEYYEYISTETPHIRDYTSRS